MVEKQNITLSLPKGLLRKAKMIAIRRDMSLSGLLVDALTELVAREDHYEIAKQRQLAWLDREMDLGTEGKIDWSRESLHER